MTDPLDDFETTAREFKACSDDVLKSQMQWMQTQSDQVDSKQLAELQSKLDHLTALHHRLQSIDSRLQESNAQLKAALEEARTDPLTGLPNRRAFDEVLATQFPHEGEHDTDSVLALIDVDSFKLINDQDGHLAGDQVLIGVAHALRSSLGQRWLVSRYGGDEFAILGNQPLTEFIETLEEIRREVSDRSSAPERQIGTTTISIGICSLDSMNSMTQALRTADAALLHAKRNGKDRCCISGRDGTAEIFPQTP